MAVSIIATAGASDANSFVTLAAADTYMEGRLNASAWDDATDDTKNRALVEATRDVSSAAYKGLRATDTQSLAWPRTDAEDPDAASYGTCFDSTEIPQRIQDATCELALEFVKAGTTDIAALDGVIGIVSETVGPLSTTYAQPSQRAQGLARFPRVLSKIGRLLESQPGAVRLVR